jgi:NitT/TauT family transport system permease protein
LHVHLLAPLSRVYGGFAIAASLAVPLGLLIGRISIVRRLLDPLCRFCAQSP